jgi:hypothetical protein
VVSTGGQVVDPIVRSGARRTSSQTGLQTGSGMALAGRRSPLEARPCPQPRPRGVCLQLGQTLPKLGVEGSNPFRRSVEGNGITELAESPFVVPSVPVGSCVRFVFNPGSSVSFRISVPR